MPNLNNQKQTLARLQAKAAKTEADMRQIAGLERNIAQKETQPRVSRSSRRVSAVRPSNSGSKVKTNSSAMSASEYLRTAVDSFKASTAAGKAWGTAVLHPPSPVSSDYNGLPDASSAPRIVPRLETSTTINWDTSMFTTAPTTTTTYSVQLLAPDIPEIAFMYRLRDDNSGDWSGVRVVRNAITNDPVNTDAGANTNAHYGLAAYGASSYRIAASSITAAFSGPDLANQGECYSGQIVPVCVPLNYASNVPTTATPGPVQSSNSSYGTMFVVPDTPQALVQRDPASMTGPAKLGCFQPLKFEAPLQGYQFVEAEPGDVWPSNVQEGSADGPLCTSGLIRLDFRDDDFGMAETDTHWNFDDSSRLTTPAGKTWQFARPAVVKTYASCFSRHAGMMWGVTFFTGLTIGASGVGAASFQVTRYTYLDVQSSATGLISAMAHSPPLYDDVALRSIVRLHQVLPSAYPAACNGFFDWIKKAFSWLSGNRGVVKDVISLLPIPGASVAGDLVEAGLPTVNALVNGGGLGP